MMHGVVLSIGFSEGRSGEEGMRFTLGCRESQACMKDLYEKFVGEILVGENRRSA